MTLNCSHILTMRFVVMSPIGRIVKTDSELINLGNGSHKIGRVGEEAIRNSNKLLVDLQGKTARDAQVYAEDFLNSRKDRLG